MVACESAEEGPGAPRMLFLEIETEYRQAEDITIARARIHRDVADGQVVSMINDVQMILNYLPIVITSYSIHYTKLYEQQLIVGKYKTSSNSGLRSSWSINHFWLIGIYQRLFYVVWIW